MSSSDDQDLVAAAQALPSAEEIASYEAALRMAAQQSAAEQEAMQTAFAKEQADLQEAQVKMQEILTVFVMVQ